MRRRRGGGGGGGGGGLRMEGGGVEVPNTNVRPSIEIHSSQSAGDGILKDRGHRDNSISVCVCVCQPTM